MEDYAPNNMVTFADPTEKAGTQAFRAAVLELWGGTDLGIVRAATNEAVQAELDAKKSPSKHYQGRAWDWGQPSDAAAVDVITRLNANGDELAKRAGLRVMIYKRQQWIADGGGWRPYGGADPHTGHVHFDFSFAGAEGRTSFYDDPVGYLKDQEGGASSSAGGKSAGDDDAGGADAMVDDPPQQTVTLGEAIRTMGPDDKLTLGVGELELPSSPIVAGDKGPPTPKTPRAAPQLPRGMHIEVQAMSCDKPGSDDQLRLTAVCDRCGGRRLLVHHRTELGADEGWLFACKCHPKGRVVRASMIHLPALGATELGDAFQ